ncbi:helix-turn-helix domain-containing protein [Frankia sp. Mgl5]|uniref:helix-turn-helix domain-containing protein n=1 Tax=Frankia sp. Mgl5 TaxID=2933793 RepID=UPI00200DF8A6|nr:helix-turn-helix domain-containing protein [Frankia sp. Mgl5]MCK9928965.1 helix-turn-helix domain-containing protein [Frankia sp. Mgl5]
MTAQNATTATDTRGDRLSPPTRRVIGILELLGARPDRSWTLAEIARELGLVPSTALAILNELRYSALVIRDETDKSYTPGPALLALGMAADARFPALRTLAHELGPLVKALGYGCSIHMRDHDGLVMAHRFGPSERFVETVIGIRYPFAPPYGLLFAAWAPDEVRDAWLARTTRVTRHTDLAGLMAETRRRGYGVEGTGLLSRGVVRSVEEDANGKADRPPRADELVDAVLGDREYGIGPIAGDHTYAVGLIGAPVFDSSGHTRFMVFLHIGGEALRGEAINVIGVELAARTAETTRRLRGAFPHSYPASGAPSRTSAEQY